jgi:hypothetical protein
MRRRLLRVDACGLNRWSRHFRATILLDDRLTMLLQALRYVVYIVTRLQRVTLIDG